MSAVATAADYTAAAALLAGVDEIDAETALAELAVYRLNCQDIRALAYVQRTLDTIDNPNEIELTKLVELLDRFIGSTRGARSRMYTHLYVRTGRVQHFSTLV